MELHIDPDSPAHKPEFNQDKTYVFYCASGGRSALVAEVALEMGLSPVVNLSGGIASWKKAEGPLGWGVGLLVCGQSDLGFRSFADAASSRRRGMSFVAPRRMSSLRPLAGLDSARTDTALLPQSGSTGMVRDETDLCLCS